MKTYTARLVADSPPYQRCCLCGDKQKSNGLICEFDGLTNKKKHYLCKTCLPDFVHGFPPNDILPQGNLFFEKFGVCFNYDPEYYKEPFDFNSNIVVELIDAIDEIVSYQETHQFDYATGKYK
jgi:hypothetical protein